MQERQVRKDPNPYVSQQQMQQQQHIGMTMIPEHTMDFSMLDLNDGAFSYQPQVYSVLSLPEPTIDSAVLSGKSALPHTIASDDEKVDLPMIERAPAVIEIETEEKSEEKIEVEDPEFDNDPAMALYTSSPSTTSPQATELDITALVTSLPSKPVQYELVITPKDTTDDVEAAMRRVERICADIDRMSDRLLFISLNL